MPFPEKFERGKKKFPPKGNTKGGSLRSKHDEAADAAEDEMEGISKSQAPGKGKGGGTGKERSGVNPTKNQGRGDVKKGVSGFRSIGTNMMQKNATG